MNLFSAAKVGKNLETDVSPSEKVVSNQEKASANGGSGDASPLADLARKIAVQQKNSPKYLEVSGLLRIFAPSERKFWLSGKHVRPFEAENAERSKPSSTLLHLKVTFG